MKATLPERRVVAAVLATLAGLGLLLLAARCAGSDARAAPEAVAPPVAAPVGAERLSAPHPQVDRHQAPTANDEGAAAVQAAAGGRADLLVRVLTASRAPSPGALIYVETLDQQATVVATADAGGIVHFHELEPGRVAVRGLTSGAAAITLRPGPNELELVQERADDLLVQVVDAGGLSIAGAFVHVADPKDRRASGRLGVTDARGECLIAALDARRAVFVSKEGYAQSPSHPLWPLLLLPPRTLRVELAPGGYALSGIVVSGATEAPVPGATVRVFALGQQILPPTRGRGPIVLGLAPARIVRTDEHGRFAVPDCAAPPLQIEVVADGCAVSRTSVDEPPGNPSRLVRILLEAAVELSGIVVDHTGAPAPNAVVHLSPEGGTESPQPWTTGTDREGRFLFRQLLPGRKHLKVAAGSGRRTSMALEVPMGEPLRVELPAPREASGRLVDAAGVPLARWSVGWSSEPLVAGQRTFPATVTVTNKDGRFWWPEETGAGGWTYAWPPTGVSMPVVARARQGTEPFELRVEVSPQQLGSLELRSDERDREQPLWARVVRLDSGLGVLTGVDTRAGAVLSGLLAGTYELSLQLGDGGWKDAGRLDVPEGAPYVFLVPRSTELDALPAGR